jgi:hypothetical protein
MAHGWDILIVSLLNLQIKITGANRGMEKEKSWD